MDCSSSVSSKQNGSQSGDDESGKLVGEREPELRPLTPGSKLGPEEEVKSDQYQDLYQIPLPYLPLECRNGENPSLASDQWGLGCLIYQMYCG